jgi:galactose-1-phosphate uridylyltransferase
MNETDEPHHGKTNNIYIPLNRDNLKIVVAMKGIDPGRLAKEISKTKSRYIREGKIDAACDFFGKDRAWYDETMDKVRQIEKELPKDLDYREKRI